MSENNPHGHLPQATVVPKRRRRISVVWAIPILAAVVAVGIAVQRILSEGPTITIVFAAAEGIEAGKTFIKYKDVNIGQVTAVQLSDDYTKVTVTAKMAKSAARLMVDDARFWVVQPQITLSGISGLGTLLSGNYIGFEAGKSDKKRREFAGLEVAPVVTSGQAGRQFVLRAAKLGSLGVGAPVYYRSLQAGQVTAYKLAEDGKSIELKIFVNAPYDRYVTTETRFWNASGVDVSVGAGGIDVRTESLVALIAGGLAFDTPVFVAAAEQAQADRMFMLYSDETRAMKQPDSISQRYVLYFSEPLRGLAVGAPVTFLGLPGGEVTAVGLELDAKAKTLRGRVEIVAYPERLLTFLQGDQKAAMALAKSVEQRHALVSRLVEEKGLRGQLQSGSLLTGQLYVAFDFHPDAPKAKVDWRLEKPVLPVIPAALANAEDKIGSILTKLDKLQYEAIGADTQKLLKDADRALTRFDSDVTPELKKALEEFNRAAATADRMLKNIDTTLVGTDAPGQQALREAMVEVSRAARSLRVLMDYLDRHPEALIRGKTEEKP